MKSSNESTHALRNTERISNLLLRTLPAIDTDLYPHAGRPGFDASGDPVSQEDLDAVDDSTQPVEIPKSSKPN
jgi:hypothetical protein